MNDDAAFCDRRPKPALYIEIRNRVGLLLIIHFSNAFRVRREYGKINYIHTVAVNFDAAKIQENNTILMVMAWPATLNHPIFVRMAMGTVAVTRTTTGA